LIFVFLLGVGIFMQDAWTCRSFTTGVTD